MLECCPKLIKTYNFGQNALNKRQLKTKNEQYYAIWLFIFKVAETFWQFFILGYRYFLPCHWKIANFKIGTVFHIPNLILDHLICLKLNYRCPSPYYIFQNYPQHFWIFFKFLFHRTWQLSRKFHRPSVTIIGSHFKSARWNKSRIIKYNSLRNEKLKRKCLPPNHELK